LATGAVAGRDEDGDLAVGLATGVCFTFLAFSVEGIFFGGSYESVCTC
jgi:hypothetical protein